MRARRVAQVIDAVERIYAGVETAAPHVWLGDALEALEALGVESRGGFAYAYDISGPVSSWRISRPIVKGMPEAMGDAIQASFAAAPPEYRSTLMRLGPTGTLAASVGVRLNESPGPGPQVARALEAADALYVNAVDPDRRGIFIGFTIQGERRLHVAERRRLAMIAAHLASARRLLVSGRSEPVAVFERSGAVAHVGRDHVGALDALKTRMDEMKGLDRRTSDPDEVLARWTALVSGRYSIVRRFDSDGRRYVFAYENPPNVSDPRGLAPQEAAIANLLLCGHSQKLIAYELGLSVGTIGGLLARIFEKVRVRSTAALIERLAIPTQVATSTEAGRELLLFSAPTEPSSAPLPLTGAEREVALAAARGATNHEIARSRATSASTVQHQLTSAYRKLGVASRSELVAHLLSARADE
ncbi:MAG: helix-turn-helix transcriptional regulator [Labilithrix sp.]|nr:helix-turn-helix transcriptional regulator [Labilithrix sp.]MCW5815442.1 helix-turn-helix transcriptional regulator [Labilithrix sp.]